MTTRKNLEAAIVNSPDEIEKVQFEYISFDTFKEYFESEDSPSLFSDQTELACYPIDDDKVILADKNLNVSDYVFLVFYTTKSEIRPDAPTVYFYYYEIWKTKNKGE